MLLSSTRRRPAGYVIALLVAALGGIGSAFAQGLGAGPGRFVDIVELTDHDDQADIVVQFTCSLRYLTHQPASEGKELRIQLQPLGDCGIAPGAPVAGELPALSGGGNIVTAARVESDVPGQVTLSFSFKKSERYVLAQSVDPRSLRLRLIDRARGRGKILLNEPSEGVNAYAVNLESQPKDFDPAAVALAHDRLKVPVFVGQAVVDGQTWYRLRAGPFDKRADADRLLATALADYPRAWLAIGDDSATTSGGASEVLPSVERIGADPALEPAARSTLMSDARKALSGHDYPKAIALLTKLQRQPEFPERAAMQELLGLARERSSQLAQAKAEYQEYLRRYPTGEAADRVARRLAVLRAASTQENAGTRGGNGSQVTGWNLSGGVGQMYRNDTQTLSSTTTLVNAGPIPTAAQTQSQNALYTDFDLLARRRGERWDMLARISAGYAKDFAGASATTTGNSSKRISFASFEMANRNLGLLGRIGRQSLNAGGVLGAFDGVYTSWQFLPAIGVNVAAGYPVELANATIQTARRFWAIALPVTPKGAHWDASLYYTNQTFEGVKDRSAAGLQARLLFPHASLSALVDYDVYFKSLNAAALLGTLQLPDRWNLSFDAEKRNAPVITARNALIGLQFTTIPALQAALEQQQGLFGPALNSAIAELARERTAVTSIYSLTATRPLGQRFQFAATVSASSIGATPPSSIAGVQIFGVPGQPASGTELQYQAQIYGSNIWHEGDFNVLSAAYGNTEVGKLSSLAATSRFPIGGAWRLGPRLTVEQQQLLTDGSKEFSFLPSALLDFQRGRRLLQFEAGGQLGKRNSQVQTQNTKRYYVSLSYRIGF